MDKCPHTLPSKGKEMTEKPTPIPLSRRVMPSLIAHDIKGVSPMVGPIDSVANLRNKMITERQGEGQVDIEATDNPENTHNQLNG